MPHYNVLDSYNQSRENATYFNVRIHTKEHEINATYPIAIYDQFMADLDTMWEIGFVDVWNKSNQTMYRVSLSSYTTHAIEFHE